jgi:uncharacterized delta-60 repeat protein
MSRALRFLGVVALASGLLASFCSVGSAAPADTDRSFGREGFVNLSTEGSVRSYGEDMAVGPGGTLYVLRSIESCPAFYTCQVDHRVDRLLANGSRDGSFGTAGTSFALGNTGTSADFSASLGVTPDGKAIVGWPDGRRLVLQRLNDDGTLDRTFGSGGTAEYDFGFPLSRARLALQGDGRIIAAVEPESGYAGDTVITARFTAGGSFDQTFNGGAPVFTTLGSGFGGLAPTPTGGAVLAGPRCCSAAGRSIHVTRLDANGALDAGFGREGNVFVDDVIDTAAVGAVVTLPNGGIYVVGSGQSRGEAFVLRLLANGKLDRRFGHRGIAYLRRSHLEVAGAATDHAGRLLVFGTAGEQLAVARRLRDGSPDRTFAGGSVERLSARGGTQVVAGGLQGASKLVVLGNAGECSRTCPAPLNFLARFIGGSATSRCAGRRATIVGTREDDELVGTRHRDVIVALAGDDVVRGRGGDDIICGGRGNDRLIGGAGRDVLRGGAGRNRLRQ